MTVTDGTGLTDSQNVAITVNTQPNVAPVLTTIGSKSVNELVLLEFNVTATDADGDSLRFSLETGAPSGASINLTSGAFTWTPTEMQDGAPSITVQVSDGRGGAASETITVTVSEVNTAPVLDAITPKGVARPDTLTFTATASDDDYREGTADTVAFSLTGTLLDGASIDPSTGVFTWTPTATQAGEHDVTVTVTDGTGLTDSQNVAITVNTQPNMAPVLTTIGSKSVNELVLLEFNVTATDADGDSLRFSLETGAPSGASINLTSGAFTWTPTEMQDGAPSITVQVSDGRGGAASETITVTVSEVNTAPVLDAITPKGVARPDTLTFTATASDDDYREGTADTVTFSLTGTLLDGASIDPSTGVFTWTPTATQAGEHDVTVTVTDGTGLTDSQNVAITVNTQPNVAPVLTAIGPKSVNELIPLKFNATATDADGDTLTFSLVGTVPEGASMTPDGAFSWTPDQSQDGDYSIIVQVSDGRGGTASQVVDVMVNDIAPLPVSARALSSSVITLTLSEVVLTDAQPPNGFSVTTQGDHVSVDSITGNGTTTLVLGLNGTISRSDSITLGYLETAGDVADLTGKPLASFSDIEVLFPSSRSRSSSPPPAITVESTGYLNSQIPQWVIDDAGLDKPHDARAPIAPITVDDTFDFPLEIDGQGYLLRSAYNTLVPHTVTVEQPTEITFTVYLQKEIMYFALYLNMQGSDTDYHDSDTYIAYDGTTHVTDPHGYISDATITVHDAFEGQRSQKKTVNITLEFAAPMGPTNMVVYTWDTDRRPTIVRMVDVLDVTAAAAEAKAADPKPITPDSELPADPKPDSELPADSEPTPADMLQSDNDDDAHVLHLIRMWSGFEPESITDAQLIDALGLTDHLGSDLPDWMMTDLGVLVAKGDVTVGEFVLALQYVLEHA